MVGSSHYDDGLVRRVSESLGVSETEAARAVVIVLDDIRSRVAGVANSEKIEDITQFVPAEINRLYGKPMLQRGKFMAASAIKMLMLKHAKAIQDIYGDPSW